MTPVIRDWVSLVDEPTALQWFDISESMKGTSTEPEWSIPLQDMPFKKCMILARAETSEGLAEIAMLAVGDDWYEGVCISGWWGKYGVRPKTIPGVLLVMQDGKLMQAPMDENEPIRETELQTVIWFLARFFKALKQATPTYIPSVKPGFISQKRIAKGKPPLYEWRTVVIQPYTATRSEPKGTHASPRLHDRRGHERRLPNGKIVWVKPCKVGNAALGTIWHDYKTTLNSQESLQA